MSLPCIPCAEPQVCYEGLDRYSLQDDLYFPVMECPPNLRCNFLNVLFVLCCTGETIRVVADMLHPDAGVLEAIKECERRAMFCTDPPPPDNCVDPPWPLPPCVRVPPKYYFSAPASCTIYCPDGTPFTYTVPTGVFVAKSQAEADSAAKTYACEQAQILANNADCRCTITTASLPVGRTGFVYYKKIQVANINPAHVFVVSSGSLPPGLTLNPSTGVISGTPTVAGNYLFTICAVSV